MATNIFERALNAFVDFWTFGIDKRAFVTGQGAVSREDETWGRESNTPSEYGDYIATSANIYSCVTMRADLLASLPLKLYKGTPKNKTEVVSGELFDLLQKVNPFWTFSRLIKMTELSLRLWGKSFWFVERGESTKGTPQELWWARPDRVRPVPDAQNYIRGFLFHPLNGSTPIFYEPHEVIWMRYPNPLDEFDGLSPLAASRYAADFATDAWRSNRNIFKNGMQMAGAMFPPKDSSFSDEQARDLEKAIDRRFKGVDKAHRFGVFRYAGQIQQMGISPKDAEFIAGLQFSLEEVCRVERIPLDLVGGQRTYANVDASWKMIWTNTILPEGKFISDELQEQLLPMFKAQADLCEFDASGVAVLQQNEGELWAREKEQLEKGAITLNEWREQKGKKKLAWGDVAWLSNSLVPIASGEPLTITVPQETTNPPDETKPRLLLPSHTRVIAYGSDEHKRLYEKFIRRTEKQEQTFAKVVAELFKRQKDSVLARLKAKERSAQEASSDPFNKAEWIKRFRQEIRPVLKTIVAEIGAQALEDVASDVTFDVNEPSVARFLEKRAQRFAREVNETTWDELKQSLTEGLDNGESLDSLIDRVEAVMGARIRSSGEVIARTEINGAANGGTLNAWKQSEVVTAKEWLAALDGRTRDSHVNAHGQRVGIDEEFRVGEGHGPHPGAIGLAEEDIQCRCSMIPVLDTERGQVAMLEQIRDMLNVA